MAPTIVRKLESVSAGSWQEVGYASWYQMKAQEIRVAGRDGNLEQSKTLVGAPRERIHYWGSRSNKGMAILITPKPALSV